jgi:hypothetical protein
MRIQRSVVAAVATAALLAAGCADDDDTDASGVTTTEPEVAYGCSSPSGQPELTIPVQIVAAGVCGYDDGMGHLYYGVIVQNVGNETLHDMGVTVDVQDTAAVAVGRSVPHQIHRLEPGGELGIGYHTHLQGSPGDVTIQVRADQLDLPNPTEAEADVTVDDVSTAVEGSTRTTNFTLTSRYGFPLQSVEVFVLYRDDRGAVIGGEQDLVPRLDPQSPVTHSVTSSYLNPAATQASVYVNEIPECPGESVPGCPPVPGT